MCLCDGYLEYQNGPGSGNVSQFCPQAGVTLYKSDKTHGCFLGLCQDLPRKRTGKMRVLPIEEFSQADAWVGKGL